MKTIINIIVVSILVLSLPSCSKTNETPSTTNQPTQLELEAINYDITSQSIESGANVDTLVGEVTGLAEFNPYTLRVTIELSYVTADGESVVSSGVAVIAPHTIRGKFTIPIGKESAISSLKVVSVSK